MSKRVHGFTLIELMIALTIIGVLTMVAFPSYQSYIRKGNRANAQSFMMEVSQRQLQYFLDKRSYAADLGTLSLTSPSSVSPYYTITIATEDGPPPAFTITATATGDQASDACGNLTLTSANVKSSSTGTSCW